MKQLKYRCFPVSLCHPAFHCSVVFIMPRKRSHASLSASSKRPQQISKGGASVDSRILRRMMTNNADESDSSDSSDGGGPAMISRRVMHAAARSDPSDSDSDSDSSAVNVADLVPSAAGVRRRAPASSLAGVDRALLRAVRNDADDSSSDDDSTSGLQMPAASGAARRRAPPPRGGSQQHDRALLRAMKNDADDSSSSSEDSDTLQAARGGVVDRALLRAMRNDADDSSDDESSDDPPQALRRPTAPSMRRPARVQAVEDGDSSDSDSDSESGSDGGGDSGFTNARSARPEPSLGDVLRQRKSGFDSYKKKQAARRFAARQPDPLRSESDSSDDDDDGARARKSHLRTQGWDGRKARQEKRKKLEKRANKNAPTVMRSDRPVPRLRQVVPVKKKVLRGRRWLSQ